MSGQEQLRQGAFGEVIRGLDAVITETQKRLRSARDLHVITFLDERLTLLGAARDAVFESARDRWMPRVPRGTAVPGQLAFDDEQGR